MKKLLVLLMVLGLATSAQAALSLSLSASTVAVDANVTVSVSNTVGGNWTFQFILSEDTLYWSEPVAASYAYGREAAVTILTAAGDLASNTPDPFYAGATQLNAGGSSVLPSAGVQFTVSVRGMQAGTLYVDLQNGSNESQIGGPLTLIVVPEPITLALLGLGGLFLRRRK